jgi:hypothetical protein
MLVLVTVHDTMLESNMADVLPAEEHPSASVIGTDLSPIQPEL